jgi:hypothetical protein
MSSYLTKTQANYLNLNPNADKANAHKVILDKLYKDEDPSAEDIQHFFPSLYTGDSLKDIEKKCN